MAPAMPHTTDREARECVTCHASSKALGYGTHEGRYMAAYTKGVYVDIMNERGEVVTKTAQYQISPIPDLPMDLDKIITREGEQLQTVGQHWPGSGPLTKEMRDNMERIGVCLSCHKYVPDGKFIYRVVSTIGETLGMIPKNDQEHRKLIARAMFIAANVEIFGALAAAIIGVLLAVFIIRRKR